MIKQYTKTLEKSPLFYGITNNNISSMIRCLNPRIVHYQKHEFITMAGSKFKELGILLAGESQVIKENISGKRVIMKNIKPGEMFGEIVVFSTSEVWPATVQALTDCTVFYLSKLKILGECESVCPWHKQLIENLLRITSERALMLNKKVEYLTIKSMRVKLSTFILEQYRKTNNNIFAWPFNRTELADYLNVSRPSMSRELGRMRDEGVIEFNKATIKIKNIARLREMAKE